MSKKYDTSKINDDWRPSCPFCHAPWTDKMIDVEAWGGGGGCSTCGFGGEPSYSIEINCSKCKRLIYKKEGRGYC